MVFLTLRVADGAASSESVGSAPGLREWCFSVPSPLTRHALSPRTSLRVVPVPHREPPFDDQVPPDERGRGDGGGGRGDGGGGVQGALALAFSLPSGAPAVPEAPTLLPVGAPDDFGPRSTPSHDLPDPQAWASLLSQAVVEVLAGHRPVAQLVRWTSARVHAALSHLAVDAHGARPVGRRPRAVVRSVHVCEPVDGIAEVAALVTERDRSWAMALRLEGVDGRWRCTVLELV